MTPRDPRVWKVSEVQEGTPDLEGTGFLVPGAKSFFLIEAWVPQRRQLRLPLLLYLQVSGAVFIPLVCENMRWATPTGAEGVAVGFP
jgi:hypothetical protein